MPATRSRAGIVVTGTEVLTGRVPDANGPWLAEQLRRHGVDVGRTVVVGDRPDDLAAALRFLGDHDLVVTTGGLGPTAQVVADVQGRALREDADLLALVGGVVEGLARRRGWCGTGVADLPAEQLAGVRKQAQVPEGASWLPPTGTAPGLVVPSTDGASPPVLVLPGPPGELRGMWPDALADPTVAAVLAGAEPLDQHTLRFWGPTEAALAEILRAHEQQHAADGLEVTTCLRDGELEVVTRLSPAARDQYDALVASLDREMGRHAISTDDRTTDEVVADLLRGGPTTVATAESCTAGLLAGRLADRPGSSAYLLGGLVTYSNEAKSTLLGVPEATLAAVGAVSEEVALAMADGARERLGADLGVGITGVAGPGGGTPEKPVGLVHLALTGRVAGHDVREHRRLMLPGGRDHVRRRTVVTALHLLRTTLAPPS